MEENKKITKELTEGQHGLLNWFFHFLPKDLKQSNEDIDGKNAVVETKTKDSGNYSGIHVVLKKIVFSDGSPSKFTVELSSDDEYNLSVSSADIFKRIKLEESSS